MNANNTTNTGLFGNNQNANTTQSSFSGGLFGNLNQSNSSPGGLFGNPSGTAASNTSGGLFSQLNNVGGGTTNTGLFGNATANNSANTGLFGGANNPASTSLFGGTTTNNPANTSAFGSTNNHTSTGVFGNTSNPNTGVFGTANNPTNPTNTNVFGSTINPTNTGLFGGTTVSNPSLFGGGTTASPFGQNQQQTQQTQPATLFGASTSNQTANQNQPLFGAQSSTNKLGSGLFSSSVSVPQPATASIFGPRSFSSLQPSASLSTTSQLDIQQRIEAIAAAWDPTSPQCKFQYYFYNMVDPSQVELYTRPPNATNDALWNRAVRENPDPKCMVPVLALGFDDLQKRVDAQSTRAKQHTEKLKELQTKLTALAQTHVLSTSRNTTRVLQTHTLITHRLLRLVEHTHLLIPNLRSAAISPEEEGLRANLERLREELSSGNGRGRLNELWALLGAVKAAREREGGLEAMEWKVVDWDGLEKLAAILAEQQQGLAHLTSVINNGLKDLQIMGDGGPRPEPVNSSYMSSMLGSHLR